MKQLLKYLFGFILFTGMLGALHTAVSTDAEAMALPQTGSLIEKAPDAGFGIAEEFLAPAAHASGLVLRQNRVQPTVPQAGFKPVESYLSRHAYRDYHTNYALIEEGQKELLPYLDPALEYVFLLRRILI